MDQMPTEVQLMRVEHEPGVYSIWIGPVLGEAPVIGVEYGDVADGIHVDEEQRFVAQGPRVCAVGVDNCRQGR